MTQLHAHWRNGLARRRHFRLTSLTEPCRHHCVEWRTQPPPIGFTFLVPAYPGSSGQRAVKRVCVCVCVCVCVMCWCSGCEAGWLQIREQVRGAGRAAKQRAVKRRRTSFSAAQLLQLDDAFRLSRYLVGPERRQLAASLQLTETQVHLLQYRYTTSSSSSSSSSASSVATAHRNTGTQSSRGKYARYPETGL